MRLGRITFHDSLQMWPGRKPPGHSSSEADGSPHQAGRPNSEGRAAEEAAARRKLRACPLADAKAAGFQSAHPVPIAFGREEPTGRPDSGQVCQAESGIFGSARCQPAEPSPGLGTLGQERASARNCERQPLGFGSWTVRQIQGFGQGACLSRPQASAGEREGQEDGEPRFSGSAERRTARASALTGSPRGKPKRSASFAEDPGGTAFRASARALSRNRPARTASPPRLGVHPRRDSGGWRRRQPPFLFRADPAPSTIQSGTAARPPRWPLRSSNRKGMRHGG